MENQINPAEWWLAIKLDGNGCFHSHHWYEKAKHSQEEILKAAQDWNAKDERKDDNQQFVLVFDDYPNAKLIQEICAYKHNSAPICNLLDDISEEKETLDEAISMLDIALSNLNDARRKL
jgi:hypothetical protein